MSKPLHIAIVGPAHPYRGGLASIMETMGREFQRRGHKVEIITFTLQYPALLFPGKSQTVDTPAPDDLSIERAVSTVNPLTWWRVGQRLRRSRPDIVLMKYWTPFMAPCFGTIARLARLNRHTKVICQVDNVEPHEHHTTDAMFNRYYLRSVDGFIYMSEQVHGELKSYTSAPALFSPHPMFEHFGTTIDRNTACESLGLDPAVRYALFFGLIRDYKGLDTLLEAWAKFRHKGHKLLIAGEFYASRDKYIDIIKRLGLEDDIILHDHFVPDGEVKNYFSASDCVVLPYKTATQSGVTQIAYNFRVPIIVTNVGGLSEIVPDGRVGYVTESSIEGVRSALERIYEGDNLERFREAMTEERKRFSWASMCDRIEELHTML
ncbi:MAG: glycosyltransferase family 4 protein [Alistipes sp.]|nr:glycosyltransferase family 4 protein [Alistipes sp.]